MKKKVHRKLYNGEIYMLVSAIVLVSCLAVYGGRFLYYHSLSSGTISTPETNLNKLLTSTENLTMSGNGLEPYNDGYLFVGFPTNNYVEYSGILWRVVAIDQEGRITMIAQNDFTILPYNANEDNTYKTSLIHRYLNPIEGDDSSGTFYKLLNSPETYLEKGPYCTDTLAAYSEVLSCGTPETSEYVSLININQYILAGGAESYLNTGNYYWSLTGITGSANTFYVFPKGGIGSDSHGVADADSYGVRPVITLKANLKIVSGSGIADNPYSIDDETFSSKDTNYLNKAKLTKYVNYGGHTWQVIGNDENGSTKLIMTDVIRDADNKPVTMVYGNVSYSATETTVGSYLNNDFLNTLDKPEYLSEGNFYNGGYNYGSGYAIESVRATSDVAKIGIPSFYDPLTTNFINPGEGNGDDVAYWTSNYRAQSMIWVVRGTDWIMADFYSGSYAVRPVIYLKDTIIISGGIGTESNPYTVMDITESEAGA